MDTLPTEKLKETCSFLGKKCDSLVEKYEKKEISGLDFVNEYFKMLLKEPDPSLKLKVLNELDKYLKTLKK